MESATATSQSTGSHNGGFSGQHWDLFRTFLDQVSSKVDEDELAIMKTICLTYLPKKDLDTVQDARTLFEELVARLLLSRDNLDVLEDLLRTCAREDLIGKLELYKQLRKREMTCEQCSSQQHTSEQHRGSGPELVRSTSIPGIKFKFDPNTAHRSLKFSNKSTVVSRDVEGAKHRHVPKRPERFVDGPYRAGNPLVLGDVAITSGKHYWEISVNESTIYIIGIAYRSTRRDERLGDNATSWILDRTGNDYETRHAGKPHKLKLDPHPVRIGILLDYEAGRVSFFDAETRRKLYTFKDHFANPVCPAFGVWDGELTLHTGLKAIRDLENQPSFSR
ncbi:SPRY domain-containing protein 4-like [Branchiostoma floridae x Branchiostoma japonicum]